MEQMRECINMKKLRFIITVIPIRICTRLIIYLDNLELPYMQRGLEVPMIYWFVFEILLYLQDIINYELLSPKDFHKEHRECYNWAIENKLVRHYKTKVYP